MVRMRFSELDDEVQKFLARAQQGETIVVEDDNGAVQCGITPYVQASSAEKQAALDSLSRLQGRTAQSLSELGVTEAQIDEAIQD